MKHILQEDSNGCGIACLAMVTNQTYQQVRDDFTGYSNEGITEFHIYAYLADRNYAWQWFYKSCIYKRDVHDDGTWKTMLRESWPLQPWSQVHIASVEINRGSHYVVVLRDGTVFDPAQAQPTRWKDYPQVSNMGAIFDITELRNQLYAVPSLGQDLP